MKIITALLFLTLNARANLDNLNSGWKVEVLITSPSLKGLESLFGHSALLVIPPGKSIEYGSVWEFQADTTGIKSDKWWEVASGGLSGKFPFILTEEPALIFFSRHIVYEFRNIQRVLIPMTSAQSENLVQLLKELKKDPRALKNYFFRTENCMTALLRVLKSSGLPINLNQLISSTVSLGMIPSQLPLIFRQLLISYVSPQISLNLVVQIQTIEKKYGLKLKSELRDGQYLDWSEFEKENFKKFEKMELVLAAHSLAIYDDKRLPYLQKVIANVTTKSQPIVVMKNFPDSFYRTCADPICADAVVKDLVRTFSKNELRWIGSMLLSEYNRSKQLFIPEINVLESQQALSWKLISNSMLKVLSLSRAN